MRTVIHHSLTAVLIWDQLRFGDDNGWFVSKPGAGALWTPWSSRQRLTDLQADSSQTCQSPDPGLFGLARVQQGQRSSAYPKFKNSPLWQLDSNTFLPPTLFTNVSTDTHLRVPHNSCPISHQTGDLYGLEVCCWR